LRRRVNWFDPATGQKEGDQSILLSEVIPVKARFLLLPAIVLAMFGSALADDDAAKKELAKLEGGWQVVSGEEDGKPAGDYVVEHLKWEFKGDRLTFKGIEPLTEIASKLTVKIDPSTNPKCIDFKVDVGSEKGHTLEGIYEWKGDELKVCLFVSFTERNRPLEFETKEGSNRATFVLKRQKP
jgi:uncharacterized protein (TIGR03067 family)